MAESVVAGVNEGDHCCRIVSCMPVSLTSSYVVHTLCFVYNIKHSVSGTVVMA